MKFNDQDLRKFSWIVFTAFLVILCVNFVLMISEGLTTRTVPFTFKNGEIKEIRNKDYQELLNNKIITAVDSFQVSQLENDEGTDVDNSGLSFTVDSNGTDISILQNVIFSGIINGRDQVEVTLLDTLTNEITTSKIDTYVIPDIIKLLRVFFYIFTVFFALSNSFILIKYSRARENLLIVMFLLLLFTPAATRVLNPFLQGIWTLLVSPFWGIFFYHFIVVRTGVKKKITRLYLITAIFLMVQYLLRMVDFSIALHIPWSVFWIIKGFLLLRKQYKISRDIQLKRLLSAFSGIGISLMSILVFLGLIILLLLAFGIGSIAGLTDVLTEDLNVIGVIIGIAFLLPLTGTVIGVLWFFGSFSWSILTGTALDVKIRSTLIYSLVGFVFVTLFGLVDYFLGEILQTVFGKFMGSEFIAGIPATIGLLLFFNPVRNYAERMVDKKLNSSDLDFLEKAETFSRNISEDGIIEGFEEYICDNLITKLEVSKVAIISFDPELNGYKFNEIRGSEVIENSLTEDRRSLLIDKDLVTVSNPLNQIQDVGSFKLIFRLLYDENHKWFLAFGGKKDGSSYNKKDIQALLKLTDKIRLSLKFILTYESITSEKFKKVLKSKDDLLKKKQIKIDELEVQIQEFKRNSKDCHSDN